MLTASQKGNIIESQIANMITLLSDGEIAASIPIVDDFGIDLLLTKKGSYKTLYLQIKSRFVTNARYKNRCDFGVRKEGFVPNDAMYVLCVYFNRTNSEIETMWLIPSLVVERESVSNRTHRIVASKSSGSTDKWSQYKCNPKELIEYIMNLI